MKNWIAEIPQEERYVYEPGCGHGPFLVAAARLLTELGGHSLTNLEKRHAYLQAHLKGSDVDDFALEIARLALTLTDIPNPDGWRLHCEDLFANGTLTKNIQEASIVLANPPYEKFSAVRNPQEIGKELCHVTMAQAITSQAVLNLKENGILGLVLPANFLHESGSVDIRKTLLSNFEIMEVGLFPDKIFNISSSECTIILARRKSGRKHINATFTYGRVTESSIERFKRDYQYESYEVITPEDVSANPRFDFRFPRLQPLWRMLRQRPRLGDIGVVGQGLIHHGEANRPKEARTFSNVRFDGASQGYWRLGASSLTHIEPRKTWINLATEVVRRKLHGTTIGIPQILFNKSPVSRGPWRLVGSMDSTGKPFLGRLYCFRDSKGNAPLEYWWALFNSPLFNAYAYSFFGKRDFDKSKWLDAPIPEFSATVKDNVVKAARTYLKLANEGFDEASGYSVECLERLKVLHLRMDAAVLDAYEIPSDLQLVLLKTFSGLKRCGVPFEQTEYLPDYFQSDITLSELIAVTVDWDKTNQRRGEFIALEGQRALTREEDEEFQNLQHLADLRIELDAMPALMHVDQIERRVASGKVNA